MTPATSVLLLLLLLVPALVLGVVEHADGTVEHSARSRRALAIGILHHSLAIIFAAQRQKAGP